MCMNVGLKLLAKSQIVIYTGYEFSSSHSKMPKEKLYF